MIRRAGLFLILLALVSSNCAKHSAVAANDLALPSGEHVTISSVHGDTFTDVSGVKRHIFYISYETGHDIDDRQALHDEAARVWAAYRPQIIGVDYDTCVVTPMKRIASGSESGRPYYLTKHADGTWVMLDDR